MNKRGRFIRCAILIITYLFCLVFLKNTKGNYFVYLLSGAFGIAATAYNEIRNDHVNREYIWLTRIISFLYACSVVMANYELLIANTFGINLICLVILFAGSYLQIGNICIYVEKKLKGFQWTEEQENGHKNVFVFGIVFVIVFLIDILYLLGYVYPGVVTPDSLWQIQQAIDNSYFNHHPFWHTIFIRVCMKIGAHIGGTTNAGVAVYSIFQILLMSFSVTYAYLTIFQMNVKKIVRYIILGWYIFMPFHIAYSATMWKDVFFGAAVLIYTTSLVRIVYGIGKSVVLNYFWLAVGTIGFTIFRNNGGIALAISLVVFCIFFRKKVWKSIIMMTVLLVAIKLINIPVFEYFNVTQTSIVESLSVPAQQIARVVVDGGEIGSVEKEFLENIVDIDTLDDVYRCVISDPVKNEITRFGNVEYIVEHKYEALKTWICIGIRNPVSYCMAWIDQTSGYWNNGGYTSGWSSSIFENEYEIYRDIKIAGLNSLWNSYLNLFQSKSIFFAFLNIGMYVWILVILGMIGIKDNFIRCIPYIPVFAIWLTLLIATPVNGEFRYIYSFIVSLPIVGVSTFSKLK